MEPESATQTEGAQAPARMSLGARLANVFIAPGEVFDEIKAGRCSVANWLVPILLSVCVGVASVLVTLSQESVVHQVREQQARAMEKRLEKLPPEQRQQAIESAERFTGPTLLKVFGIVGAVGGSVAWPFLTAFYIWLVGRFALKGNFEYLQALEVCGLAVMITILGGIITTLLILITGNPNMTPGPALLVRDFDSTRTTHLLVASVNVMSLWYIGVVAIGLARLSGASLLKAGLWVFTGWALLTAGLIGIASAFQRF